MIAAIIASTIPQQSLANRLAAETSDCAEREAALSEIEATLALLQQQIAAYRSLTEGEDNDGD